MTSKKRAWAKGYRLALHEVILDLEVELDLKQLKLKDAILIVEEHTAVLRRHHVPVPRLILRKLTSWKRRSVQ
jgi:hypothetical protein